LIGREPDEHKATEMREEYIKKDESKIKGRILLRAPLYTHGIVKVITISILHLKR
jgi:hypothetical protein